MVSRLWDQVGCLEVPAFVKVVGVFIPAFRRKNNLHQAEHECLCLSGRGGREKRGHRV